MVHSTGLQWDDGRERKESVGHISSCMSRLFIFCSSFEQCSVLGCKVQLVVGATGPERCDSLSPICHSLNCYVVMLFDPYCKLNLFRNFCPLYLMVQCLKNYEMHATVSNRYVVTMLRCCTVKPPQMSHDWNRFLSSWKLRWSSQEGGHHDNGRPKGGVKLCTVARQHFACYCLIVPFHFVCPVNCTM